MSSSVLFGGSGFVGTHLAQALGVAFERVYIADIRQPRWRCDKGVPVNPRALRVAFSIVRGWMLLCKTRPYAVTG